MWIHDPKPDVSRAKEVKVKIPVGHHVKLHSIKVLTGKAISDAVTEALDAYFATHRIDNAMLEQIQLPAEAADGIDPLR